MSGLPDKGNRDDPLEGDFTVFDRRRRAQRRRFYSRQPKRINEVMAQLAQRRGYAQVRAAEERENAWQEAVGEELAKETQVGPIRRGTLEVFVANSLLMQELSFRKEALIKTMQMALPETGIKQIRFRIGQIS